MLCVAIVHSISLLYSISFYEYNKIHLSIFVLTRPKPAQLSRSDKTGCIQDGMVIDYSFTLFVMGVRAISSLGYYEQYYYECSYIHGVHFYCSRIAGSQLPALADNAEQYHKVAMPIYLSHLQMPLARPEHRLAYYYLYSVPSRPLFFHSHAKFHSSTEFPHSGSNNSIHSHIYYPQLLRITLKFIER